MDYKKTNAPTNTVTRDMVALSSDTGNIYETVCILNYQFNHTSSFFVLSTINSLSSTESSWAIRYSVSRLGCCLLQQ